MKSFFYSQRFERELEVQVAVRRVCCRADSESSSPPLSLSLAALDRCPADDAPPPPLDDVTAQLTAPPASWLAAEQLTAADQPDIQLQVRRAWEPPQRHVTQGGCSREIDRYILRCLECWHVVPFVRGERGWSCGVCGQVSVSRCWPWLNTLLLEIRPSLMLVNQCPATLAVRCRHAAAEPCYLPPDAVLAPPLTEVSTTPLTEISTTPLTEVSTTPFTEVSTTMLREARTTPLTDISTHPSQTPVSYRSQGPYPALPCASPHPSQRFLGVSTPPLTDFRTLPRSVLHPVPYRSPYPAPHNGPDHVSHRSPYPVPHRGPEWALYGSTGWRAPKPK